MLLSNWNHFDYAATVLGLLGMENKMQSLPSGPLVVLVSPCYKWRLGKSLNQ